MKDAFSVFVFGKYEIYLPYYIYTIEQVYPNCDVIVFYNDKLSEKISKYINQKSFVKIYEDFYQEYDYFRNYKMFGGGGLTLLRYLIPGSFFEGYRYVYFGDVDVVILKDYISLFDFHKNQIINCNVPFSNRIRFKPDGKISKRLTGLHFVEVMPYFKSMDLIIQNVLLNKKFREEIIKNVNRDEEFLFYINNLSFKIESNKGLIHNLTPLHGFHLGVFRDTVEIHHREIEDNTISNYSEIKSQFKDLIQDPEFVFIINVFYCKEIIRTLSFFKVKIPFNLKLKYYLNENYIIRKMKRKIIKFYGIFKK